MFGRVVTGLWAALHLLLEVLPEAATDVRCSALLLCKFV
jgi:hypothetical protein